MITLLALLLMATRPASVEVETCPGGPLFGFAHGSDRLDSETEKMLDIYVEHLNEPLWRSGWITVYPTVVGPLSRADLRLAKRRNTTIVQRLADRGVEESRVRFTSLRSAPSKEADADVYPSTLTTPRVIWQKLVSPGVMC